MNDAALLELRLLRERVDALADEQRHLIRALLAPKDRRIGTALLPLADELLGAVAWTAPDLARRAVNAGTPEGRAAFELIEDATAGDPFGESGLRALGRMLVRLEGATLAGLRLERVRKTREGLAWRLVRVSDAG